MNPENPRWEGRDRFFLDPGHMSPMLYSVLALTGKFTMEELSQFRQWDSPTPGHPEVNIMRGIENTSGPLGQGHTYAVGAAIAAKFLKARLGDVMNQTIYAYISRRWCAGRDFSGFRPFGRTPRPRTTLSCSTTPTTYNSRRLPMP